MLWIVVFVHRNCVGFAEFPTPPQERFPSCNPNLEKIKWHQFDDNKTRSVIEADNWLKTMDSFEGRSNELESRIKKDPWFQSIQPEIIEICEFPKLG